MRKCAILLFVCIFLLGIAASSFGAATQMFGRTALTGGTKSVDNIADAGLVTGDICIVIDSSKQLYFYRFNNDSTAGEASPWVIQPDDAGGNGDWELVLRPNSSNKLDLTEDTTLTATQVLHNRYITNQGDAGEAEFVLPDLAYVVSVTFIVEEAQNLVVQPPAGELLYLDGVALDADDCVDSDSTVGSMITAVNHQKADGDWNWHLHTVYGVWTDTGDCDP